jgi:hypothetical protein
MDVFSSLSKRMKIVVVGCALLLLSLSIGVLAFGNGELTADSVLIKEAAESVKADMLYAAPGLELEEAILEHEELEAEKEEEEEFRLYNEW